MSLDNCSTAGAFVVEMGVGFVSASIAVHPVGACSTGSCDVADGVPLMSLLGLGTEEDMNYTNRRINMIS